MRRAGEETKALAVTRHAQDPSAKGQSWKGNWRVAGSWPQIHASSLHRWGPEAQVPIPRHTVKQGPAFIPPLSTAILESWEIPDQLNANENIST